MSGLGSAIDELAVADLTGVPVSVVGDELVELLALRARLDAQITRRVGHVDRQGIAQTQACASTSTWLVGVARLGRGEAVGQVRAARALHRGDLPTTAAAYGDGRISLAQVRAIEATADGLDPQLVAEAEPTPGRGRRASRPGPAARGVRAVPRHRGRRPPREGPRRRDETRTLFASRTLGGMVAVKGMLTPLVGEVLLLALDAVSGPLDLRTPGQPRSAGTSACTTCSALPWTPRRCPRPAGRSRRSSCTSRPTPSPPR